jgi:FkbM family methyltransferase
VNIIKNIDKLLNSILNILGIKVLKLSTYEERIGRFGENAERTDRYFKLLHTIMHGQTVKVINYKSQFGQDIFVLHQLNFKKNGFFVEFGATDGVSISNTFILEKEFGWNGILAEPAKIWHKQLNQNRGVIIDNRCVWSVSKNKLAFNETDMNELSTIASYSSQDMHRDSREYGKYYQVETISLLDLLNEHNAPQDIDYLSIDTEGSEYDIIKDFDFNRYNIKIITIEHNFTEMREKIFTLLSSHGYKRVLTDYSLVDDWYIKD